MKIILLLLLALFTSAAFCQSSGSLSGFLKQKPGVPAPDVTVSIVRSRDHAFLKRSHTAKDGSFAFFGLMPDSYTLVATSVEFKKVTQGPVVVRQGKVILDTIFLSKAVEQLKEVLIRNPVPLIQWSMDKTTINVEHTSLATGNTALDILSHAPGLTVLNDGTMQLNGKSGVTVMIDGKLTYLSSAQLATLLRSTNSSQIKSVEIMSHPPVKYEASGSGGLINIMLKRNKEYGSNGTITAEGTLGKYLKANTGISLNKRTKHLNVYGNYNYADNKRYGILNLDRAVHVPGIASNIGQRSHSTTINHNHNYKGGIDYDLNESNTVGFAVNGYSNDQSEVIENQSIIGNGDATPAVTSAHNSGENAYSNISYSLNYRSLLDTLGQQLNIDLALLNYDNSEQVLYENRFLDPDGDVGRLPVIFRNISATDARIKAVTIGYTLPLTKTAKLDMGIKSSIVKTGNDFLVENKQDALWLKDLGQSNTFRYGERINAAYVNLDKSWTNFEMQLGLRAEHTSTEGLSVSTSSMTKTKYLDLFPVLSLSQKIMPHSTVGLVLNRRIDRPSYGSLNPFMYFLDLYTYKRGNEYLKPQYTNGIAINYQLLRKYSLELGYSSTTNVITNLIKPDPSRNALFTTPENLSRQNTINMSLSVPVGISDFWNVYNDVAVYQTAFSSDDILGSEYRSGQVAWNVKSLHTVSLSKTVQLDLSGNYQSTQLYGTSYLKSFMFVDIGASSKWFNERMTAKFAVKDLFNQKKQIIYSNLPGVNYTMYDKPETRLVSMALSYAFGGKEIKPVRSSRNGIGEESGRIGR
jgi:hypothetical protein